MSLDHIGYTVVAQAPSVRAAEYVRMSTEHQQYSTENQRDRIREYAVRRGLEIVRTYADEGKSGLRIDGRQALQQLIKDVESGRADFHVILVYDVSRWGRFQDADESAYYEYVFDFANNSFCLPFIDSASRCQQTSRLTRRSETINARRASAVLYGKGSAVRLLVNTGYFACMSTFCRETEFVRLAYLINQ